MGMHGTWAIIPSCRHFPASGVEPAWACLSGCLCYMEGPQTQKKRGQPWQLFLSLLPGMRVEAALREGGWGSADGNVSIGDWILSRCITPRPEERKNMHLVIVGSLFLIRLHTDLK